MLGSPRPRNLSCSSSGLHSLAYSLPHIKWRWWHLFSAMLWKFSIPTNLQEYYVVQFCKIFIFNSTKVAYIIQQFWSLHAYFHWFICWWSNDKKLDFLSVQFFFIHWSLKEFFYPVNKTIFSKKYFINLRVFPWRTFL